jgi:hypothetical protein
VVKDLLNEPTYVVFSILNRIGVPDDGSVVFSSTATANSGNDDAYTTALKIMGYTTDDHHITFVRSSACTTCGLTGVSKLRPKNDAVKYDPETSLDKFPDLARSLAGQFLHMTINDHELTIKPTYDVMYHNGCISQNWTTNSLGNSVSNWELHEQWNVVMTVAMMWHIAMTL